MIIHITTKSGARYTLNQTAMSWTREHATIDLHWMHGEGVPHGTLADWPVVVMGRQLMFDDINQGMIVTTPVMKAEIEA